MARPELLPDVLGAIYDAALQADAWPAALTALGLLLGGTWLKFSALRASGTVDLGVQDSNGDPAHFALFQERYNQPDANPAIIPLQTSAPGTILLREQQIADDEWESSDLYREIFRPYGVYHALCTVVLKTATHIVPLGINRPKAAGRFTIADLDLLQRVTPHLQQAIRLFIRLTDLESRTSAHEALWDSLPYGVIQLDGLQRVLWANSAAATMLAGADGLSSARGALFASSAAENPALQQLIAAAVATGEGRGLLPGGAIALSRPSLKRPLELLVAPLRIERAAFGRRPAAVVIVSDPEQQVDTPPELLARLYGLTPREAALTALLLQGIDLREATDKLGMARHTARTHLRYIFEKTGTHRQAELVGLLLRGPAGLLKR